MSSPVDPASSSSDDDDGSPVTRRDLKQLKAHLEQGKRERNELSLRLERMENMTKGEKDDES